MAEPGMMKEWRHPSCRRNKYCRRRTTRVHGKGVEVLALGPNVVQVLLALGITPVHSVILWMYYVLCTITGSGPTRACSDARVRNVKGQRCYQPD